MPLTNAQHDAITKAAHLKVIIQDLERVIANQEGSHASRPKGEEQEKARSDIAWNGILLRKLREEYITQLEIIGFKFIKNLNQARHLRYWI